MLLCPFFVEAIRETASTQFQRPHTENAFFFGSCTLCVGVRALPQVRSRHGAKRPVIEQPLWRSWSVETARMRVDGRGSVRKAGVCLGIAPAPHNLALGSDSTTWVFLDPFSNTHYGGLHRFHRSCIFRMVMHFNDRPAHAQRTSFFCNCEGVLPLNNVWSPKHVWVWRGNWLCTNILSDRVHVSEEYALLLQRIAASRRIYFYLLLCHWSSKSISSHSKNRASSTSAKRQSRPHWTPPAGHCSFLSFAYCLRRLSQRGIDTPESWACFRGTGVRWNYYGLDNIPLGARGMLQEKAHKKTTRPPKRISFISFPSQE